MRSVRKAALHGAFPGGTAATLLLVAALAAAPAARAATAPKDTDITEAVHNQLGHDRAVPQQRLQVTTHDGIVQLEGRVDNLLVARQALQDAMSVKGVRAVIDRVEVVPISRPDDELARDIKTALSQNVATGAYDVGVVVRHGTAILTGEVDSWQQRQLVDAVTRSVRGLRAVDDNVAVTASGSRSDAEIRQDVLARLRNDARLHFTDLEVQVHDGAVRLSGTAASAAERALAERLARVQGVKSVNAGSVDVDWWTTRNQRPAGSPPAEDTRSLAAIQEALRYDPRVGTLGVEVTVNDGVAELRGVVGSLQASRAAAEDAANTAGIGHVVNLLNVQPEDPWGADTLVPRLERVLRLDAYLSTQNDDMTVSAEQGRVTLTGSVGSAFERQRAENLVAGIAGVTGVRNELKVRYRAPTVSDARVRDNLIRELRWDPRLDSNQIQFTVENGLVTLRGSVDDWPAHDAAERNAYEAGARNVYNLLEVVRGP